MGLEYAITADIISALLFFYLSSVYFLTPRKGNRLVAYLLTVFLYLIWNITTRYFREIQVSTVLAFWNHLCYLAVISLLYRDGWKRKLACLAFVSILGLSIDMLTGLVMISFNNEYYMQYLYADFDDTFTNQSHLMSLLISEVCNTTIALFYLTRIRMKNWKYFFSFLLLPVYEIFIMAGYFMLCGSYDNKVANIGLAMGIFNFLLNITVLYLLEEMFRKLQRENEVREIEKKRTEEYEYYKSAAEATEEFRLIRHDFANQLQTVYGMMDEPENAEKVKAMLADMKKNLEEE